MTPIFAIGTDPDETDAVAANEGAHLRLASSRPVTRPRLSWITGATLGSPGATWARGQRIRLALADSVSIAAVLTVLLGAYGKTDGGLATLGGLAVALAICVIAGAHEHAHVGLPKATLDEIPALAVLSGLTALGITIVVPIFASGGLSGGQVGLLWLLLLAAMTCGRTLTRILSRGLGETQRCVVIGDPDQAERLQGRFEVSGTHASVVAAIPMTAEILSESEVQLESAIREIAHELHAQRIVIAPTDEILSQLPKLIRVVKAVGVAISMLPGTLDCVGHTMEFEDVNGVALIGIRSFGLSPMALAIKRTLDIFGATIMLLILSPLLVAIAITIRLDSPGSVFFRQTRVGRDGRHFEIIKFRSMVPGAEERKNDLRALSEAGDGLFKIADDPRVTRVGRFLRRSSLDELPQIFNVLRGEMSLVGPRPLVVEEDCSISGLDRSRLRLMPGMTGPWQILRQRVSRPEMVEIDYRYVAGWSLWLDIKILVRTFLHVVRRGNL